MLEAYVEANRDRFVAELAEYCAIPSVAAAGRGIEPAAAYVTRRLEGVGATVTRLEGEGAPVIFGEIAPPEATRTLLIYNHYDVQPPEPLELWESEPFVLTERDGKLYARGIADNKANFLSRIHALEGMARTGSLPPLRILWLVEGEEEIGSPTLPAIAAREGARWADADGCLWEAGSRDQEGRTQLYSGLKGIAYFELRVRSTRRDAHSSLATLLPNAAWRLVWALATLKDADERILIDGFYDAVQPPSAAERDYLASLPPMEGALLEQFGLPALLTGVSGVAALVRHLYEPTCTICGLTSGYGGPGTKTVLPHAASAKLDFRLVPQQTPAQVEAQLRAHLIRHGFDDIEVVPIAAEHPGQGPVESAVVHAAMQAVREETGIAPLFWPRLAGSGPMYPLTDAYGIPVVGFGTGYIGSAGHAPNENIRLADYLEGVRVAGAFFDRFAAI